MYVNYVNNEDGNSKFIRLYYIHDKLKFNSEW